MSGRVGGGCKSENEGGEGGESGGGLEHYENIRWSRMKLGRRDTR